MRYALFKDGIAITEARMHESHVMLHAVMLMPDIFNCVGGERVFKDGYSIEELPSATILPFKRTTRGE